MKQAQCDWLERFLSHLRTEKRLSPHTERGYTQDLNALVKFCDDADIDTWAHVTSHHVRNFAATLHRQGLAPRSIQRRLSAARSFFNYLLRERILQHNPANGVSAPKVGRRLPETLDADQVTHLVSINGDEIITIRDRAIMELLYSSGLRLGELTALNLGDIDSKDRTVRVIGKGDKTRVVPVGKPALAAVLAWQKVRANMANQEEVALFVGKRGKRISPRSVEARVAYWAKRQGISTKVYPHLFRHSFATHILESSGNLRAVQELLGHADISTTQIYTHLDFQHLARIYDETHPRAKKKVSDDA